MKKILVPFLMTEFILSGCGTTSWYTPAPAEQGVSEQWQIQRIRCVKDSTNEFNLEIGVSTLSKRPDYSFWLSQLKWNKVTLNQVQSQFGMGIDHQIGTTKASIYELSIRDTRNMFMPATKVGYGQSPDSSIVDSVLYEQLNQTQYFIIVTNKNIEWMGTNVDPTHQIVSFTWNVK